MDIQRTEAETDAMLVFGLDLLVQGLRYLSGGDVTKKEWTIAAVTWRSIPMTLIDCPVTSCGLCGQKSLASNRQLRLVVTFSRSAFLHKARAPSGWLLQTVRQGARPSA